MNSANRIAYFRNRLKEARRNAATARRRVLRQREIVAAARSKGMDVEERSRLLETMEGTLELFEQQVRILDEQLRLMLANRSREEETIVRQYRTVYMLKEGVWANRLMRAKRATSLHRSQLEAIARARFFMRRGGGELVILDENDHLVSKEEIKVEAQARA